MTTIAASRVATIGASIGATLPDGAADPILDPDNPNLVAFYTMDNISGATLVDESPNGNDGTITGATAVAGQIGNALSFDGVNDKVALGDFYQETSGAICMWFVGNSTSPNDIAYGRASSGTSEYFTVFRDHTTKKFQIQTSIVGPGVKDIIPDPAQTDGTHFVVFQSTGSAYEIYIDGVSVAFTVTNGTDNGDWTSLFTIGYTDDLGVLDIGSPLFSQGIYDQVRFFSRHLTQTEITALFDEGAP
jgi:hypothetical protein